MEVKLGEFPLVKTNAQGGTGSMLLLLGVQPGDG